MSIFTAPSAPADDDAGEGSGGEIDPSAALLEHPFPSVPTSLPILPLRHLVLFPGVVAPLTIGRASARKMLEESLTQSKVIGLFSQVDPRQDEPGGGRPAPGRGRRLRA